MNVDALYTLVTSAIWRAQQLAALGVPTVARAWSEVSALEEELAHSMPTTRPEGRTARRGAVRAALLAGDSFRAHDLTRRFSEEPHTSDDLRAALDEMLEADAASLASRFPFAARHHAIRDARELARHLRRTGAFGLAA
ncbi:MAG: hypothetical protein GXP62_05490 [Oligoflexia bacterium]|nr:hypothetical protein [Oligoflexia bacterium]